MSVHLFSSINTCVFFIFPFDRKENRGPEFEIRPTTKRLLEWLCLPYQEYQHREVIVRAICYLFVVFVLCSVFFFVYSVFWKQFLASFKLPSKAVSFAAVHASCSLPHSPRVFLSRRIGDLRDWFYQQHEAVLLRLCTDCSVFHSSARIFFSFRRNGDLSTRLWFCLQSGTCSRARFL